MTREDRKMEQLLQQALSSADETLDIRFGDHINGDTGAMFRALFPGRKALVVADENTFAILGETIVSSLAAAGVDQAAEPFVFPGTPTLYGSYENVTIVREHLAALDETHALSIGAGTLNDIVKLASGELGRGYVHVCTAASVDGFAAFGASISRDGFKITRNCPAPTGLVADVPTMVAAPHRLTATGYGDLIEKIPAGADWILADELGEEAIDDYAWSLVQPPLHSILDDPAAIAAAQPAAISRLGMGQLLSGLAMQATKSSRPASGAGHLFSHVWEMEGHGLDQEPPLSHGFKVAVGTVASLALWQKLLTCTIDDFNLDWALASVRTEQQCRETVQSLLAPRMQGEAEKHTLAKRLDREGTEERVRRLVEHWPSIQRRCAQQVVTPEQGATMLQTAGAPWHPEQIGIDWQRFRETHRKAALIRNRYTILDLLTDLGLLDQFLDELFTEDGFWGQHRHP